MDSQTLVSEQIDAGRELVEQFDRFMPVSAAFWLKPSDADSWLLYIVGPRVQQEGIAPGNREIVRICQQINSPYLDLFQVRLIAPDDPLAQSVLPVYRRYPGKLPIRYGGGMLGGTSIDGSYLYSVPAAATSP